MKNKCFKILLLCGLLLVLSTVSFAQQKKKKIYTKMIRSEDFKMSVPNNGSRKNNKKKIKKGRKGCRYYYYKRKGRTYRVYRCRQV